MPKKINNFSQTNKNCSINEWQFQQNMMIKAQQEDQQQKYIEKQLPQNLRQVKLNENYFQQDNRFKAQQEDQQQKYIKIELSQNLRQISFINNYQPDYFTAIIKIDHKDNNKMEMELQSIQSSFQTSFLVRILNRILLVTLANKFFDQSKKYIPLNSAFIKCKRTKKNQKIDIVNKYIVGSNEKSDSLVIVDVTSEIYKNVLEYNQGFKIAYNLTEFKDYNDIFILGCSEKINKDNIKKSGNKTSILNILKLYQCKIQLRHIEEGKQIFYQGNYQIDDGFCGCPIIKRLFNSQQNKFQFFVIGLHYRKSQRTQYKSKSRLCLYQGVLLTSFKSIFYDICKQKSFLKQSKPIYVQMIQQTKQQLEMDIQNPSVFNPPSNSIVMLRHDLNNTNNKSFGQGIIIKTSQNQIFIATCCSNICYNSKFTEFNVLAPQKQVQGQPYQQIQIYDYSQILYQTEYFRCRDQFLRLQYQAVLIDINFEMKQRFFQFEQNQNIGVQIGFGFTPLNQNLNNLFIFSYSFANFDKNIAQLHQKALHSTFKYWKNSKNSEIQNDHEKQYQYPMQKKKIKVKLYDKQFIYYEVPTQIGQCGAGIFTKKNQKFYLIGLHIGKCQNDDLNFGILFSERIKETFQKKITQSRSETKEQKLIYYQKMQAEKSEKQLNNMMDKLSINNKRILSEPEQKTYPFSNSVVLRMNSQRQIHQSKSSFYLGSGVIVTIQGKQYIVTVCHNLYNLNSKSWMKSFAFLKKESQLNNIRKNMQIQQSMIHYNESYIQNGNILDQPAFIQLDDLQADYIKDNKELSILFDWNKIRQQQVYLIGFPYSQNSKIIDMTNIDSSSSLNLCFRKLMTQKLLQQNKILTYKVVTQQGEGGGALIVFRSEQQKYYLIGLHIGKKYQGNHSFNIGVLFTSELKQKFPQIFKKRQRPQIYEDQISITRSILLVQEPRGNLHPMYRLKMKDYNQKIQVNIQEQIQMKAAIDFYQYLIQQYNNRNIRGNETGSAKDWSEFFRRIKKQYRIKIQFLEKNQKCQKIVHQIISNIESQKNKFDKLMYIPNRNFQFSESTIAKILRVHILPHAQELVKILQGYQKIIRVKDLEQIHKPYAWQYFPGGRREPYS